MLVDVIAMHDVMVTVIDVVRVIAVGDRLVAAGRAVDVRMHLVRRVGADLDLGSGGPSWTCLSASRGAPGWP